MSQRVSVKSTGTYRPLDRDAARSPTLPGFYYSDPMIFAEETRRIFDRSWQLVAHVSELEHPGDFVCAEIVDEPVFVIRSAEGAILGFYNVCQHRAHGLLTGKGRVKSRIVCPYHAWTYGLDGRLATARHTDAMPDFERCNVSLTPIRVETILGFVFVNLDPGAMPLAETADDMFEDMARTLPWIREARINPQETGWDGSLLDANWKVLAENCLECYHCGPAHPALVDLVDMKSYACIAHGAWLRSAGKLLHHRNKAYDVRADEPVQEAAFWHLWPNVEFGVLPGERALGAFRFYPETAERTRMTGSTLSLPGESIAPERRHYRWNVLWPEDEALCRSVHRGLKSKGYRQGRFVVHPDYPGVSEHAVHYFQRRYAEIMGLALK